MYAFVWKLLVVVLIQMFALFEYSHQEAVCEYVLPNTREKKYRICKYSCCKRSNINKICCDDSYEPSPMISILITVSVVLLMLLILMIFFVIIRYKKITRHGIRNGRIINQTTINTSDSSYPNENRESVPDYIYTISNPSTNVTENNEPPKYDSLNLTEAFNQTKAPFNSSLIQNLENPSTSQEITEPLPPYVKNSVTEDNSDGKRQPNKK